MFKWLAAAFIIIPALEIWGLFEVGQLIGGWQTFALLLLSGFIGAWLAKREARKVWTDAREQLANGQLPGKSLLDGICIFAGGILMITPGFLSDVVGLLLVFPLTRPFFRLLLLAFIQKKLASDRTFFTWRK